VTLKGGSKALMHRNMIRGSPQKVIMVHEMIKRGMGELRDDEKKSQRKCGMCVEDSLKPSNAVIW